MKHLSEIISQLAEMAIKDAAVVRKSVEKSDISSLEQSVYISRVPLETSWFPGQQSLVGKLKILPENYKNQNYKNRRRIYKKKNYKKFTPTCP